MMLSRMVLYRSCCLILIAQGILSILRFGHPAQTGAASQPFVVAAHLLLVVAAGLRYVFPRRDHRLVFTAVILAWATSLWTGCGMGPMPGGGDWLLRLWLSLMAVAGMERWVGGRVST